MWAAAGWIDEFMLPALLQGGGQLEARDATGHTPLLSIQPFDHGEVAAAKERAMRLLDAGANPRAEADDGRTLALLCQSVEKRGRPALSRVKARLAKMGTSAKEELEEEFRQLLEGLTLRQPDSLPIGGLSTAVSTGDLDWVQRYLDDGAEPEGPWRDGFFPVEIAKACGDDAMLKLLMDAGATNRPATLDEERARLIEERRKTRARRRASRMRSQEAGAGERAREHRTLPSDRGHRPAEDGVGYCHERTSVYARLRQWARSSRGSLPRSGRGCERCVGTGVGQAPSFRSACDGRGHGREASRRRGRSELRERGRKAPDTGRGSASGRAFVGATPCGRGRRSLAASVNHPINFANGPQRNAIRRLLRDVRRPKLEKSKRRPVLYKKRKRMYDAASLVGMAEYDGYYPQGCIAFVEADMAPFETPSWNRGRRPSGIRHSTRAPCPEWPRAPSSSPPQRRRAGASSGSQRRLTIGSTG